MTHVCEQCPPAEFRRFMHLPYRWWRHLPHRHIHVYSIEMRKIMCAVCWEQP